MTTPTHRASDVTLQIMSVLTTYGAGFGIKRVEYGDQQIIVDSPMVCVVPTITNRSWSGSSQNTDNSFETSLLVYGSGIRNGVERVQQYIDRLAEDLADFFNVLSAPITVTKTIRNIAVTGDRLGGLVTHGLSTRIEYAYKVLGDELTRMNRVVLTHESRTNLVGD